MLIPCPTLSCRRLITDAQIARISPHCRASIPHAPFCPRLAAIAAVTFLGAAGQLAPQRLTPAYSDEQKAELDKISAYLNGIHSLKARFIQIGPEGGMDQGTLYIQKPGQIRFEYNPPSALLIVATDGRVYVKNSRLNTLDTYDLSDTPLGLLLNQNVDLKTNRAVMGVNDQNGMVTVQARTSTNRNNSNITMVFSSPGLELRQWTVRDNQGGNTTVALQSLEAGRRHRSRLVYPAAKGAPHGQADPRPSRPMKTVGIVCDRRVVDGMAMHTVNDEYVTALRDGAGALPLLIPSTDTPLDIGAVLAAVDGLLFTGAPSNVAPRHYGQSARPGTELDEVRDATTLPLLRAAIESGQAAARHLPRLPGTERGAGRQPASACA